MSAVSPGTEEKSGAVDRATQTSGEVRDGY